MERLSPRLQLKFSACTKIYIFFKCMSLKAFHFDKYPFLPYFYLKVITLLNLDGRLLGFFPDRQKSGESGRGRGRQIGEEQGEEHGLWWDAVQGRSSELWRESWAMRNCLITETTNEPFSAWNILVEYILIHLLIYWSPTLVSGTLLINLGDKRMTQGLSLMR